MKIISTLSLILALSASSLAIAQSVNAQDGHAGHHAPAATAGPTTYSTIGIVKKVNIIKGTVTVAHEPIPDLNQPAMTMDFSVKDKALFDKLTAGQRITLEFQLQGADHVVTAVK